MNATEINEAMLAALKAAYPHVQRLAAATPTTNSRLGRALEARKVRREMEAVINEAEQLLCGREG